MGVEIAIPFHLDILDILRIRISADIRPLLDCMQGVFVHTAGPWIWKHRSVHNSFMRRFLSSDCWFVVKALMKKMRAPALRNNQNQVTCEEKSSVWCSLWGEGERGEEQHLPTLYCMSVGARSFIDVLVCQTCHPCWQCGHSRSDFLFVRPH